MDAARPGRRRVVAAVGRACNPLFGRAPLCLQGPRRRACVGACGSKADGLWLRFAVFEFPGWTAAPPAFDFRQAGEAAHWQPLHDLTRLEPTPDGMVALLGGEDPYLAGPARDYPSDTLLWLNLRLRSDSGGTLQVFYFRDGSGPTEPASVRFAVCGGEWVTARVPMPALGVNYRLRIDPLARRAAPLRTLWFEHATSTPPSWPRPVAPTPERLIPPRSRGPLSHGRKVRRFAAGCAAWLRVRRNRWSVISRVISRAGGHLPRASNRSSLSGKAVSRRADGIDPDGGHCKFDRPFVRNRCWGSWRRDDGDQTDRALLLCRS
jgi:hypothetical protein